MHTILLFAYLIQIGNQAADATKPLPNLETFLQGIRRNLHSDRILLSQYTYLERTTFRQLNAGGKVSKTELREYEVYPSLDEKSTYRKLIARDGKPLTTGEMEKQERAYSKKILEDQRRLEKESPDERRRREAKEADSRRKEEEAIDEAFRLYRVTGIGRESLEGQSAIVLSFEPRPDYRPKSPEARILAKVHGKAWFTEEDQQLIRLEVELGDNLSFGFGLVAKLNRGSRMVFQRRRVNNEIWLPGESHFSGTGRVLVFKGFRVDVSTVYSEYKKFSVQTSVRIEGQKKP